MTDHRNEALGKILIDYSLKLRAGETLYLEMKGKEALDLGKVIIRLAAERGVTPFWFYNDESLQRQWLGNAREEHFRKQAEIHLEIFHRSDAYIGVRGSDNPFDLSDIDEKQIELYNALFYKPVHLDYRVKKTRWVVLRYPNNAMAQLAETSQEKFADFYYRVCCADYSKMSRSMDRLVQLMESTDKVHIKGPGTDLRFSIQGIPAIKCAGLRNIPDGEVFTAPHRESVNGRVTYNAPSLHQGVAFHNIMFEFERGKIIRASCDGHPERLNRILDTDEGARYIGEFSLAVNPFILHPMRDTLFDEKIAGSFHFTPGQCYDVAPNGNRSAIHWDLVQIQRPEYGGGEVWFDGKLVRKDGKFTDQELETAFSAENLKGAIE